MKRKLLKYGLLGALALFLFVWLSIGLTPVESRGNPMEVAKVAGYLTLAGGAYAALIWLVSAISRKVGPARWRGLKERLAAVWEYTGKVVNVLFIFLFGAPALALILAAIILLPLLLLYVFAVSPFDSAQHELAKVGLSWAWTAAPYVWGVCVILMCAACFQIAREEWRNPHACVD
jgi:hypothetical protein